MDNAALLNATAAAWKRYMGPGVTLKRRGIEWRWVRPDGSSVAPPVAMIAARAVAEGMDVAAARRHYEGGAP